MVRIFRHYVSPVKLTLAAVDFIAVYVIAVLAEYSILAAPLSSIFQDPEYLASRLLAPFFIVPCLLSVGVYEADSFKDGRVRILRILIGLSVAALFLAALMYLFQVQALIPSIFGLGFVLAAVTVLIIHILILKLFGGRGGLANRILIIGSGEAAKDVIDYLSNTPEAGMKVVSCMALEGEDSKVENAIPLHAEKDLADAIDRFRANMIIVSERLYGNMLVDALIASKINGLEVRDRADFYEQVRGYVDLKTLDPNRLLFTKGFNGGGVISRLFKRFADLLLAILFALIVSPVILITAILVKLTSKGPVFYVQERVGLHGKTFNLYKFRSMKVDAEKGDPQWADKDDPRTTPIGKFIRKTRIDEIPQVLNVIRGHMSLVGPRPERPFFVEKLSKDIPFYKDRHWLKPGITGWAQVRYPYGASFDDARRKLEHDLYYIKNYSTFLDLLIILQTIRVILFPKGVR